MAMLTVLLWQAAAALMLMQGSCARPVPSSPSTRSPQSTSTQPHRFVINQYTGIDKTDEDPSIIGNPYPDEQGGKWQAVHRVPRRFLSGWADWCFGQKNGDFDWDFYNDDTNPCFKMNGDNGDTSGDGNSDNTSNGSSDPPSASHSAPPPDADSPAAPPPDTGSPSSPPPDTVSPSAPPPDTESPSAPPPNTGSEANAPSPAEAPSEGPSEGGKWCSDPIIKEMIDLDNQKRSAEGTDPLECSEKASELSYEHSLQQCEDGDISHDQFEDRCNESGFNTCGENVAYTTSSNVDSTVTDIHKGWWNSPGHRANIKNVEYGRVGYAYHACQGEIYWTGFFGN